MVRVGLVIQRLRVRVSGQHGIVGGGNVQRSLHPQYHNWGALEQGTKPPTAPRAPQHKMAAHCSGCVFTVCMCVCTLDGLIAEHEFRVWVTILSQMSRHFHFHNDI